LERKRLARQRRKPLTSKKTDDRELHVCSYEITDAPIMGNRSDLPEAIKDEVEDIYGILKSDPKRAISQLVALKKQYPHIPVLYNYLTAAYSIVGDRENVRALTFENYQKNPDYLFAKVNYAQLCLYDGEIEKIPEIFDHKFDLKLLYPKRKKFHVSEFAAFTGVMCVYFNEVGERKAAEILHSALQGVAPESEMVTFAKEFLYPSLLSKLRKWARRKRLRIERAQTEHEKNIIKRMPDKKEKDDDYNLEA
jgi:hypothetical protein